MASKASAVPQTAPGVSNDKKMHMRLDIMKVSMVGDVSLGDEVEVSVKGRVTSMRGPEESYYPLPNGKEKEQTYPGCLEVEVSSVKVQQDGAFAGMEDDEEY